MKPRLALYLGLLPKRWWEYTYDEKRELASTYEMIIGIEPPDVRNDIRRYNPNVRLIYPWMPQLIPSATRYWEWNPSRHRDGWNLPQILRDRHGEPVASERSYGRAWVDCSKPENVSWLVSWIRNGWQTKLGGYDGFTLEVSCWTHPWRGFFPADMELETPWADFQEQWTDACRNFMERLRLALPDETPLIISGSDWLAGSTEPMDGRLVEDFGLRCTWLEDTMTRRDRSIHDSQTRARNGGPVTIVKEGTHFPTPAAYAAAAMWDTYYTVMGSNDWLRCLPGFLSGL